MKKTKQQWLKILSPEQYAILFEEHTECAFSSFLNHEKRSGTYHCAACYQAIFKSEMKYNSGTGWPSFKDALPNALRVKIDYKLVYPRTEYHCSRCEGHHGHVFKDGPAPSGLRYCNNGLTLIFIAEGEKIPQLR